MTDEEIFAEAIQHSGSKRTTFLDSVCVGESQRRERIEQLIRAHESPDSYLENALPESGLADTIGLLAASKHPVIGNYKLLHKLGEGGFGVVYMAEQLKPVRRKVAIKILKADRLGDPSATIARFEAERQALAMMDHPNIATIFDGGTLPPEISVLDQTFGSVERPFFVMELVNGVPITDYCDKNNLPMRERLELFATVCQAVHHAHQKGVIHRDLKPSNILVTLHDGHPVVKIIDFGVAKAINQQLTEKTLYTVLGDMIGTPLYMSPEQAERSGLDIDTRSDVYSLGVLLYELLTGSTPITADELKRAGLLQIQRRIVDSEPPKPSTRLSTSGEKLTIIAKHRSISPERLHRELRGDLDWIVMKALEKDRTRRYESASSFGDDVRRFLADDLVEARPPSRTYQLQKLLRKNRGLVAGTLFSMCALLVGITISLVGWRNALSLAKELERKNYELQEVLVERAIADAMSGNFERAKLSIAQAEAAGTTQDLLLAVRGLAFYFAGDVTKAIEVLSEATIKHPKSIGAWAVLFKAYEDSGEYEFMGECRQHLLELKPTTEPEKMFRAMTDLYARPKSALADLEGVTKSHPHSAIFLALKANAMREVSLLERDLSSFEECLKDFDRANVILPSTPFIQSNYLLALIFAIQLSENQRPHSSIPDGKIDEWKAKGKSLCFSLESVAGSEKMSRVDRATFYRLTGNESRYREIVASGSTGGTAVHQSKSAEMFAECNYDALQAFLTNDHRWAADLYRLYARIDAENLTEQTREKIATELFGNVVGSYRHAYGNDVLALDAFLYVGDVEGLKMGAQRIRKKTPSFEWHMYERTLNLFMEPTLNAEEEYLKQAIPFSTSGSYAHYVVGMLAFARGDRERAKEHFRLCTKMGRFDWWSHVWADAFLKRMEADKKWPHWIELKSN